LTKVKLRICSLHNLPHPADNKCLLLYLSYSNTLSRSTLFPHSNRNAHHSSCYLYRIS
jgi:hypothetical protein